MDGHAGRGGEQLETAEQNRSPEAMELVNAPPVRNWGLLRSCPRWARPAQKVFFSPIEDEFC
jgi:hypothetical protein